MKIAQLQAEICKRITRIGGKIKWKKELGLPARLYYLISQREPVINIEALLLGERFAVIIDSRHRNRSNMFNANKYRIFVCSTLDDFTKQFEAFKQQKLNER